MSARYPCECSPGWQERRITSTSSSLSPSNVRKQPCTQLGNEPNSASETNLIFSRTTQILFREPSSCFRELLQFRERTSYFRERNKFSLGTEPHIFGNQPNLASGANLGDHSNPVSVPVQARRISSTSSTSSRGSAPARTCRRRPRRASSR